MLHLSAGAVLGAALTLFGTWLSPRWTQTPRRKIWEFLVTGVAGAVLGGTLAYKLAGLSAAYFFYVILAGVLVTASLVDLHDRIIPNELVLFAAGAGIVMRIVAQLSQVPVGTWLSALWGALFGAGLLFLLGLLYRGGLGMGDVKLAGALGLYLGFLNTAVGLMIAFILGGAVSLILLLARVVGRKDYIPFGPFLAAGALIAMIWAREILAYLNLA